MTDYLTRFSCLLDVGTPANVARAFDIYTALMAENGREDPPAEPFLLSLTPEHGASRLCLCDPGTADPQLLITFVTRCAETFKLTGRWGFQWAGVASDPVIDGFSGGAHILDLASGRTLAWMSTGRWLAEGGAR
ncbi:MULTISPECIES: hypothetical protein [unclassified Rhizobium]|jgi:hypothetical protein|uniref:hypothetical protein n=1 Tax=unclassified Rhizobium TaxID=2613769 RepID=UPI000645C18D|nr:MULTISPECIES: hypothetical protein [unclassified Rhizobium]OJY74069.1 MAG: hypothetical protein BGP09_27100 [Rhizobium sp. 60-20]RKD61507.1 hypothetical protein BJ928_107108 [Rhizobium sp. WW_1]